MIHKILFFLSFFSFAFSGALEASSKKKSAAAEAASGGEAAARQESSVLKLNSAAAAAQEAASGGGAAARQESSVLELNSAAAAALVQRLTLAYPARGLEACRLKGNYAFTRTGVSVNPGQNVTLIHFSLPRDRDLFIHPDFSEFISDDALEVDELLEGSSRKAARIRKKAAKAKLFRAFHALAQYTGKTTALALKKKEYAESGAAPARTTVTKAEIDNCALPTEYTTSRIFYDDDSEGYIVIQEDGGKAFLRGITWYCPLATWSKGFRWEEKGTEDFLDYSHLSSAKTVQDDDGSTLFPRVAELSILCASGCGGDLLRIVKESVLRSGKFSRLLTDAKETIISFYEHFGFTSVTATAQYKKTAKAKRLQKAPYRHWFSSDAPLIDEENQLAPEAHLYTLPIRRTVTEGEGKLTLTFGKREYRKSQEKRKRKPKPKPSPTTVTASVEDLAAQPTQVTKAAQAAQAAQAACSARPPSPSPKKTQSTRPVRKRTRLTQRTP